MRALHLYLRHRLRQGTFASTAVLGSQTRTGRWLRPNKRKGAVVPRVHILERVHGAEQTLRAALSAARARNMSTSSLGMSRIDLGTGTLLTSTGMAATLAVAAAAAALAALAATTSAAGLLGA